MIALLIILCLFVANPPLFAADEPAPLDIELLSRGRPIFPIVWNAYRPAPLPPVNHRNGPQISSRIQQGKLSLSLSEFLKLVVENNLSLQAARYNYLISQIDLLRARSGQAARGAPSVPVPGALFAGAIGAGVGNSANFSNGGTGATAISGSSRSVVLGPRGTFDPTISINMSWDRLVNPLNSVRVAGTPTVAIPSAVLQTIWQQELPFGTSLSCFQHAASEHDSSSYSVQSRLHIISRLDHLSPFAQRRGPRVHSTICESHRERPANRL